MSNITSTQDVKGKKGKCLYNKMKDILSLLRVESCYISWL